MAEERYGYYTDWTGATHKVQVVAETLDGRLVIDVWEGLRLVDKSEVEEETP